MIRLDFNKGWLFLLATLLAIFATILERTAARNVQRAWDVAGQNPDVLIFFWVGRKNCLQQGAGVRMTRRVEFVAVKLFHHVAKVHDGNAVAEQAHQCHVVADENVRYALLALKLDQQLDTSISRTFLLPR